MPLSQPQISKLNSPPQNQCFVHVSWSISPQTRFFGAGVAMLRSYFMNSFGSYFEYKIYEYAKNIPNFGIQQYNKSTTNLGAHNSNCFTMFDPHTRRSHPFMSGAPGAAVSFTWDATQDEPCLFVQLASSSGAERVFSTGAAQQQIIGTKPVEPYLQYRTESDRLPGLTSCTGRRRSRP